MNAYSLYHLRIVSGRTVAIVMNSFPVYFFPFTVTSHEFSDKLHGEEFDWGTEASAASIIAYLT
jgi:hypothetical protein